jgi:hypothetical protein
MKISFLLALEKETISGSITQLKHFWKRLKKQEGCEISKHYMFDDSIPVGKRCKKLMKSDVLVFWHIPSQKVLETTYAKLMKKHPRFFVNFITGSVTHYKSTIEFLSKCKGFQGFITDMENRGKFLGRYVDDFNLPIHVIPTAFNRRKKISFEEYKETKKPNLFVMHTRITNNKYHHKIFQSFLEHPAFLAKTRPVIKVYGPIEWVIMSPCKKISEELHDTVKEMSSFDKENDYDTNSSYIKIGKSGRVRYYGSYRDIKRFEDEVLSKASFSIDLTCDYNIGGAYQFVQMEDLSNYTIPIVQHHWRMPGVFATSPKPTAFQMLTTIQRAQQLSVEERWKMVQQGLKHINRNHNPVKCTSRLLEVLTQS